MPSSLRTTAARRSETRQCGGAFSPAPSTAMAAVAPLLATASAAGWERFTATASSQVSNGGLIEQIRRWSAKQAAAWRCNRSIFDRLRMEDVPPGVAGRNVAGDIDETTFERPLDVDRRRTPVAQQTARLRPTVSVSARPAHTGVGAGRLTSRRGCRQSALDSRIDHIRPVAVNTDERRAGRLGEGVVRVSPALSNCSAEPVRRTARDRRADRVRRIRSEICRPANNAERSDGSTCDKSQRTYISPRSALVIGRFIRSQTID